MEKLIPKHTFQYPAQSCSEKKTHLHLSTRLTKLKKKRRKGKEGKNGTFSYFELARRFENEEKSDVYDWLQDLWGIKDIKYKFDFT